MENNIYEDESWGLESKKVEREGVERDFNWEPLNEGYVIKEPVEQDITGYGWSNEVFFKYV